jgi:hypothetical protein
MRRSHRSTRKAARGPPRKSGIDAVAAAVITCEIAGPSAVPKKKIFARRTVHAASNVCEMDWAETARLN